VSNLDLFTRICVRCRADCLTARSVVLAASGVSLDWSLSFHPRSSTLSSSSEVYRDTIGRHFQATAAPLSTSLLEAARILNLGPLLSRTCTASSYVLLSRICLNCYQQSCRWTIRGRGWFEVYTSTERPTNNFLFSQAFALP